MMTMIDINLLLLTILMTSLGAISNVLIWAQKWEDLTSFEAIKSILLGFIVGVVWFFVRTERNLPDSLISFVIGYTAKDFIEALIERFKNMKIIEKT